MMANCHTTHQIMNRRDFKSESIQGSTQITLLKNPAKKFATSEMDPKA